MHSLSLRSLGLLLSTLLIACSSPSTSSATLPMTTHPATPTTAASAATEVVRSLIQQMIARDLPAMDKLLSPGFTLTHITGYKQSRAEWLEEVRSESMRYYSAKEVSVQVRQEAGRQVVTIRHQLDARIWGTRRIWSLQQVMTLEEQGGSWQILHSVATLFR